MNPTVALQLRALHPVDAPPMMARPQNAAAQALPPLTSSGQQASSEYGPLLDGGVHRPSVPDPAHTRANVVAQLKDSRLAQEGNQEPSQYVPLKATIPTKTTHERTCAARGVKFDPIGHSRAVFARMIALAMRAHARKKFFYSQ